MTMALAFTLVLGGCNAMRASAVLGNQDAVNRYLLTRWPLLEITWDGGGRRSTVATRSLIGEPSSVEYLGYDVTDGDGRLVLRVDAARREGGLRFPGHEDLQVLDAQHFTYIQGLEIPMIRQVGRVVVGALEEDGVHEFLWEYRTWDVTRVLDSHTSPDLSWWRLLAEPTHGGRRYVMCVWQSDQGGLIAWQDDEPLQVSESCRPTRIAFDSISNFGSVDFLAHPLFENGWTGVQGWVAGRRRADSSTALAATEDDSSRVIHISDWRHQSAATLQTPGGEQLVWRRHHSRFRGPDRLELSVGMTDGASLESTSQTESLWIWECHEGATFWVITDPTRMSQQRACQRQPLSTVTMEAVAEFFGEREVVDVFNQLVVDAETVRPLVMERSTVREH
jgi:hypothetical protein